MNLLIRVLLLIPMFSYADVFQQTQNHFQSKSYMSSIDSGVQGIQQNISHLTSGLLSGLPYIRNASQTNIVSMLDLYNSNYQFNISVTYFLNNLTVSVEYNDEKPRYYYSFIEGKKDKFLPDRDYVLKKTGSDKFYLWNEGSKEAYYVEIFDKELLKQTKIIPGMVLKIKSSQGNFQHIEDIINKVDWNKIKTVFK